MNTNEEIGYGGESFEYLPPPNNPSEVEFVREGALKATAKHFLDEEVDMDVLKGRMWNDRMPLKKIKEKSRGIQANQGIKVDMTKQHRWKEQARRKKMERAQAGILKYM